MWEWEFEVRMLALHVGSALFSCWFFEVASRNSVLVVRLSFETSWARGWLVVDM